MNKERREAPWIGIWTQDGDWTIGMMQSVFRAAQVRIGYPGATNQRSTCPGSTVVCARMVLSIPSQLPA